MKSFFIASIICLTACATAFGQDWTDRKDEMKAEIVAELASPGNPPEMVEYFAECLSTNLTALMDKLKCEQLDKQPLHVVLHTCLKANAGAQQQAQALARGCLESAQQWYGEKQHGGSQK